MLLRCNECELVFREDDAEIEEELIGEAWGRPIYERWLICPKCGQPVGEYDGDEEPEVVDHPFEDMAYIGHPRRRDD